MDGPAARRGRGDVLGGVAGHQGFQLATQAVRVGLDPWRVLAPGGRVEKLIERELIRSADKDRTDELTGLVRGGAVLAGQVAALSLGAQPEWVLEVGRLMLEADEEVSDGE